MVGHDGEVERRRLTAESRPSSKGRARREEKRGEETGEEKGREEWKWKWKWKILKVEAIECLMDA